MGERFTVSLDDDNAEWVETEAQQRDRSKAWVINEALRATRGEDRTDPVNAGAVNTGEHLTDRVDELEERLSAIEDAIDRSSPAADERERAPRSDSRDRGDGQSDTRDRNVDSGARSGSESGGDIDEVVAGVYEGKTHREARREAGVAALQWLREHDGAPTASDFKNALYPDYQATDENEDTWWKKNARPAVTEARDRGLVEFHGGRKTYRWVGED